MKCLIVLVRPSPLWVLLKVEAMSSQAVKEPANPRPSWIVYAVTFRKGATPWLPSRRPPPTIASVPVTARKDEDPAAVQAANVNVAGLVSISAGDGLIQTTSG